jgi:hypothetical protein
MKKFASYKKRSVLDINVYYKAIDTFCMEEAAAFAFFSVKTTHVHCTSGYN